MSSDDLSNLTKWQRDRIDKYYDIHLQEVLDKMHTKFKNAG